MDWCRSWNSHTLATWCEKLSLWKRPWCWARLKAGEEGGDRGWDGWMASPNQWTWVWASSGSWWWTGKPGVLQSMESQRVRHDWATELSDWSAVHLVVQGLTVMWVHLPIPFCSNLLFMSLGVKYIFGSFLYFFSGCSSSNFCMSLRESKHKIFLLCHLYSFMHSFWWD